MIHKVILVILLLGLSLAEEKEAIKNKDLVVVTVSNGTSDAFQRFMRSSTVYGYNLKVLVPENDQEEEPQILPLLQKEISKQNANTPDRLIMFVHGPLAILSAGPSRVVEEYSESRAGILVSAEGFLTGGGKKLEQEIPTVKLGKRFPNAKGFIGTASSLSKLLHEFPEAKTLQEIFISSFTKNVILDKFGLQVDSQSTLFQNLNGASGEVELRFVGKESYLQNTMYSTVPIVIVADEGTKTLLDNVGSYLARAWNSVEGCKSCWENMLDLEKTSEEEMPTVTIAAFVEKAVPFLEEFMMQIDSMKYPKSRIHLYLHNALEIYSEEVTTWVEEAKGKYKSVYYIPHTENIKEWHAKDMAIDHCLERDCEFLLILDSEAHLDNPYSLKLLIEQNRQVLSPLLTRPSKAWSNFWGALTPEGFYARSEDYMEIVQNNRRGVWNVPYISSAILIQRKLLENKETIPSFVRNLLDADMAFCNNMRDKGVFLYITNRVDLGHLVSADNFEPNRVNAELWQVFENRWDWEKRYLHLNYSMSLDENYTIPMPCPDVYWFPVFTERFSEEVIELMESYGVWSDGSHDDPRLDGGYESVPTVDIHMKQVAYEAEWLEILRLYIQPLQLRAFEDYYNDVGPPRALMSFMVRYKPDEQPSLRPHHDTATYTINVALNRPKLDYEGGGCRFIRYNCSVTETRLGWILMHPGRLTHLHEGLPVTKGTRYIIVTFIDP